MIGAIVFRPSTKLGVETPGPLLAKKRGTVILKKNVSGKGIRYGNVFAKFFNLGWRGGCYAKGTQLCFRAIGTCR
jgi:hypothetical protein